MSDALCGVLGSESTVRAYYDDSDTNVIAIVEVTGAPAPRLTTFATASLHASENILGGQDIRVELILVGETGQREVGNLLATSGFYLAKNRWLAAPGVVFPDVVSDYFPNAHVKHLMWVAPFDFAGLSAFSAEGLDTPVHGLQGVPITDAEHGLLIRDGFDALERALESGKVLHYDFGRTSVV